MAETKTVFIARDGEKDGKNSNGLAMWLTDKPTLAQIPFRENTYLIWQGLDERGVGLNSPMFPEIKNGKCHEYELKEIGKVE